jgi:hypothetical protein
LKRRSLLDADTALLATVRAMNWLQISQTFLNDLTEVKCSRR